MSATMPIFMAILLTVSFQYIIYNNITFSYKGITIQKHTSNHNNTDKSNLEYFNLINGIKFFQERPFKNCLLMYFLSKNVV